MTNSFPPPPSGWQLAQVSYQTVLPHPDLQAGAPLDFGTGVTTQLAYSVPVLGLVFTFSTPGQSGAFDQTAAESGLAGAVTQVCTVLAGMSGVPLADLQAQVTVTRSWTWTAGASSVAVTDTMTYP